MLFLLTYTEFGKVEFSQLLNADWSFQISGEAAVRKVMTIKKLNSCFKKCSTSSLPQKCNFKKFCWRTRTSLTLSPHTVERPNLQSVRRCTITTIPAGDGWVRKEWHIETTVLKGAGSGGGEHSGIIATASCQWEQIVSLAKKLLESKLKHQESFRYVLHSPVHILKAMHTVVN